MKKYSIASVLAGGGQEWVVIATDDGGSKEWLTTHTTATEARAAADRLTAIEQATGATRQ